ncbi:unnamed protein product [Pseudo-nitzschia multistriata]|uniref:Nitroreductase domain-containing protein n=1 Tax=Pseudo-nitzschia multistriata TaxID=183589 RepID=A0A448Z3L7_9STRA|nr:unnamed protein product [Pseudo-nitzschia multistriata]
MTISARLLSFVLAALAAPQGSLAFSPQRPMHVFAEASGRPLPNESLAPKALPADDDPGARVLSAETGEAPSLPASTRAHALEVFGRFASREHGGQKFVADDGALYHILRGLDIEASEEDAAIVFRYLDSDGDGRLEFEDEFLPWYLEAVGAATGVSAGFRSLLVGRRTVEAFDETPVDDAVLERAVQCAIAAPNRSGSEPWRFRKVGRETVRKLAALHKARDGSSESTGYTDWESVAPGWCVVTRTVSAACGEKDGHETESGGLRSEAQQDFKSVCCSIQNFMLSMWSEGIGTKWTTGPLQTTTEFATICGIDTELEAVVGIIWYGYATGGTRYADPKRRKLGVGDVLGYLP